jgi:hypothetical protein
VPNKTVGSKNLIPEISAQKVPNCSYQIEYKPIQKFPPIGNVGHILAEMQIIASIERINTPKGPRKSETFSVIRIGILSAAINNSAKIKSQFDVCGAPINT